MQGCKIFSILSNIYSRNNFQHYKQNPSMNDKETLTVISPSLPTARPHSSDVHLTDNKNKLQNLTLKSTKLTNCMLPNIHFYIQIQFLENCSMDKQINQNPTQNLIFSHQTLHKNKNTESQTQKCHQNSLQPISQNPSKIAQDNNFPSKSAKTTKTHQGNERLLT